MRFEIKDDDHLGIIQLEDFEKELLISAASNALYAADEVDNPVEKGSNTESLCHYILSNRFSTAKTLRAPAFQLMELGTLVENNSLEMPYEDAQQTGGFISELRVAARLINDREESVISTQNDANSNVINLFKNSKRQSINDVEDLN